MSASIEPLFDPSEPPQQGHVPPQNLDAERSLLGGVMLDNEALDDVLEIIKPPDFYRETHRKIFEAMQSLAGRNEPIDRVTLKGELTALGMLAAVGGEHAIDLLDITIPSASNLRYYAKLVRDAALRRQTIEACASLTVAAYEQLGAVDALLDNHRERFLSITAPSAPKIESRTISMTEATHPPVERCLVGSLFPFGKASVIYGPSGCGKSVFLSQLAFRVAGGGTRTFLGMHMHDNEPAPVLVYSAEDTFDDWKRKAAAVLAGCDDINIESALPRLHVIYKSEGQARLSEEVQVRVDIGAGETCTRRESRPTAERLAIIERAKAVQARVVLLETTSRLVPKEDNEDMAGLLSACGHIADATGAAVILSHHPTKNSSKDNDSRAENARGGGAFINNSRCAVSLFPAEGKTIAELEGRGLHFDSRWDVVVLEQPKGTSSVRKQEPIVLVRCPTPTGAVLQLPELIQNDPQKSAAHAERAGRQERRKSERFGLLFDKVSELAGLGPVSKNRLRGHHGALGVAKNDVDELVDQAVLAGVLTIDQRDKKNRILALGLGKRPTVGAGRPLGDYHDAESRGGSDD